MHHVAALRIVGVVTGCPLVHQRRGHKDSAQQGQLADRVDHMRHYYMCVIVSDARRLKVTDTHRILAKNKCSKIWRPVRSHRS
jgi:hypothetical protein